MNALQQRYLDLLKNVLTDYHRMRAFEFQPWKAQSWKTKLLSLVDSAVSRFGYNIRRRVAVRKDDRMNGRDWPAEAESMIGIKRLKNIEDCIRDVIANGVEGDLIETGVWRGGATIYMKAVLQTLGDAERIVWVADSFEGLPPPDAEKYPLDAHCDLSELSELAISMEEVKANFEKYGLLDERVKFLKGWFKDTLPNAPFQKLCLARLDGDLYESTMDSLKNLYPKLSPGGYCIIDDWGIGPGAKQAVLDYCAQHSHKIDVQDIDGAGVFWKKI
jgi:O-methyltransferase